MGEKSVTAKKIAIFCAPSVISGDFRTLTAVGRNERATVTG